MHHLPLEPAQGSQSSDESAFKCGRGSVPGAALTHHHTLVELESYPHGAGGQQPEIKVWAGLGTLREVCPRSPGFWWLPTILGVPQLVGADPQLACLIWQPPRLHLC